MIAFEVVSERRTTTMPSAHRVCFQLILPLLWWWRREFLAGLSAFELISCLRSYHRPSGILRGYQVEVHSHPTFEKHSVLRKSSKSCLPECPIHGTCLVFELVFVVGVRGCLSVCSIRGWR